MIQRKKYVQLQYIIIYVQVIYIALPCSKPREITHYITRVTNSYCFPDTGELCTVLLHMQRHCHCHSGSQGLEGYTQSVCPGWQEQHHFSNEDAHSIHARYACCIMNNN